MNTAKSSGYIVRSEINPRAILCTDGELHGESQVGGGTGYVPKVYRSEAMARKHNPGRIVEPSPYT